MYWICRALSNAQPMYNSRLDIGAVIPVKAYKYGMEVPGQIKASFNRPRGRTCEDLKEKLIIEFSKKAYNEASNTNTYVITPLGNNLLDSLPDFDLEELVITYIQVKENYYLLSNSIAKHSTTIKVECEFISRDKNHFRKAVVQVKGGKGIVIDALDYKRFDDEGYIVYLFAPSVINQEKLTNCSIISRNQLEAFYREYKAILPDSITKWENLI